MPLGIRVILRIRDPAFLLEYRIFCVLPMLCLTVMDGGYFLLLIPVMHATWKIPPAISIAPVSHFHE
jgi:hypothetical protein